MAEENIELEARDRVKVPATYRKVEGAEDCVVLSHGINTDRNEWNNFFLELADIFEEAGFSSLRFDFRGHGESQVEDKNMTVAGIILDLKAAADFADEDKIHLLGSSFGGLPSIYVADQIEVASLILLWPLLDTYGEYFEPENGDSFYSENRGELERKGFIDRDDGFRMGAQLMEELRILEPYRVLSDLEIPVLTVQGMKDSAVDPEIASSYGKPNSESRFLAFEDVGHGLVDQNEGGLGDETRQNWEELKRELADWLQKF